VTHHRSADRISNCERAISLFAFVIVQSYARLAKLMEEQQHLRVTAKQTPFPKCALSTGRNKPLILRHDIYFLLAKNTD
jgi:hypothetical protein